jgi:hypothetical protein
VKRLPGKLTFLTSVPLTKMLDLFAATSVKRMEPSLVRVEYTPSPALITTTSAWPCAIISHVSRFTFGEPVQRFGCGVKRPVEHMIHLDRFAADGIAVRASKLRIPGERRDNKKDGKQEC